MEECTSGKAVSIVASSAAVRGESVPAGNVHLVRGTDHRTPPSLYPVSRTKNFRQHRGTPRSAILQLCQSQNRRTLIWVIFYFYTTIQF